jgi:hypothetical protein
MPSPRRPRSGHRTRYRWTKTTLHSTACVRDRLRPTLQALGLDEEAVDDTVLAASEIIANATEHADGPYELRLRNSGGYLVVEVHERSHHLQALPAPVPPRLRHRRRARPSGWTPCWANWPNTGAAWLWSTLWSRDG